LAATLCRLATTLPDLVATLLDQEDVLKRGRFREETFTDIFTGSMAAFAGPDLVMQYPPETTTGGDLDLEFWNVGSGRRIMLRIQAKRLNAETENGKSIGIYNRSYRELLHKVPSTGKYQFRTLVDECGPLLPLYMFYNHRKVTENAYFNGKLPNVSGINLAFAFDIAEEMETKIAASPKRLHHKRLSHLHAHFFGLEAIFCPPGNAVGAVPSPDQISASLQNAWNNPRSQKPDGRTDERILRRLQEPLSMVGGRSWDRRLPDGPAIRVNPELERPTITLISGRTDDDRTPRISDQLSRE